MSVGESRLVKDHLKDIRNISDEGEVGSLDIDPFFKDFNVVGFHTRGGNNSYLHAINQALYGFYRTQVKDGVLISRDQIVSDFRLMLAKSLTDQIDMTVKLELSMPSAKYEEETAGDISKVLQNQKTSIKYDILDDGNIRNLSKDESKDQNFSLDDQRKFLNGKDPIMHEYNPLITVNLGVGIFIFDASDGFPMLSPGQTPLMMDSCTSFICLLYRPGHYDTMGIVQSDGRIITQFQYNDDFIKKIIFYLRNWMDIKK